MEKEEKLAPHEYCIELSGLRTTTTMHCNKVRKQGRASEGVTDSGAKLRQKKTSPRHSGEK